MLTPKENFLQVLQTGKPDYAFSAWDASAGSPWGGPYLVDPLGGFEAPCYMPGTEAVDMWGVKWIFEDFSPAAHPSYTDEDKVVTDIAEWKKQVTLPDIKAISSQIDWTETEAFCNSVDRSEKLVVCMMFPGILERFITLLGFEDAVFAFYDEPEAAKELLEAITDVKIAIFDETYEHCHPDMIEAHDDWGNANNLSMSIAMWHEFVKPYVARFYAHMKEKGVIISHHSDCFTEPLAPEMVELGIDIWQGGTIKNNLQAVKIATDHKLVLMTGIQGTICDGPDATEESIRAEVRRAIAEYAPGGYYIPCVTSEECLDPTKQAIVDDECRKADVNLWN